MAKRKQKTDQSASALLREFFKDQPNCTPKQGRDWLEEVYGMEASPGLASQCRKAVVGDNNPAPRGRQPVEAGTATRTAPRTASRKSNGKHGSDELSMTQMREVRDIIESYEGDPEAVRTFLDTLDTFGGTDGFRTALDAYCELVYGK